MNQSNVGILFTMEFRNKMFNNNNNNNDYID